tara:strand:+ start:31533 stop:33713 length:2181 start_codon:yes stop_codon:yes gene_type:complete
MGHLSRVFFVCGKIGRFDLTMKKVSILLFFIFALLKSQDSIITGSIIDRDSDKAIFNVNISSIPSGAGTQTNEKGEFSFILANNDSVLVIQHIGYQTLRLRISNHVNGSEIRIDPRVIEMNEIDITGINRKKFFPFDTENSLIELSAKDLTIRSFMDVGDALFSEQSVLMNENILGRKTMSIRGAAAEEMVYMYDGIQINAMGNPVFDLSMLNILGLSGMEIVRGSNEQALSSSGTVNFIPKLSYGSEAYFTQRIGTYNSGSWSGLGSIGKPTIGLTSGLGESESSQIYEEQEKPDIKSKNSNRFLHLGIQRNNRFELRILGLMNGRSNINRKTQDSLNLNFQTWIIKLMTSYPDGGFLSFYLLSQIQDGFSYSQIYNSDKNDRNRGYGLQFNYPFLSMNLNLKVRKNIMQSDWDVSSERIIAQRAEDDITGSLEFKGENSPSEYQIDNIKIIFSRKSIKDNHLSDDTIFNTDYNWREKGSQITISLLNQKKDRNIFIYCNLGSFFRIPSLQEKFLSNLQPYRIQEKDLVPEYKHAREAGLKIEGGNSPMAIDYKMDLAIFSYYYNDKIKQIQYSGSNIRFPINFGRANLSGLDANVRFRTPQRNFHASGSYSFYIYSDQIAFPLQPVKMLRGKLFYTYKGFSIEYIIRSESSRIWTSISNTGDYYDNKLSPIFTYDAHASYKFLLKDMSISIGINGKNLANNKQFLEGISIFDRRVYLTMEVRWK